MTPAERARQIDAEITRRKAGGTDFTTGHTRTPTQTDSAVNHQIDRDPLEPDHGPERDL